ncbi:MAG: peptide-methionine (S)-S-oxide reductase MsrA [Micavibrio aeruginosavorus]|nr:peptide-methionine (S)-S-oxide reductase MsrA [Micavibrio aeruginosavorus]
MKSIPLRFLTLYLLVFLALIPDFTGSAKAEPSSIPDNPDLVTVMPENLPKATFAGGCFWCLESEFRNKPGVVFTRSGYTGGATESPTYEQVTTGKTGHAEAVEIYYDPDKTNYQALLDHFLRRAHDPTTLNRQWVDEGTQYRSAIFYHDEAQKTAAEDAIARISGEKIYKSPIVTQVLPAAPFWPAEDYHQQYYEKYEQEKGSPHLRVILKDELKKKAK